MTTQHCNMPEEFSEVWCCKCERPSTVEFVLTTGERRAYCDDHAWLLRAPRGIDKARTLERTFDK